MQEIIAGGGLFKHNKTGGIYHVVGLATAEATHRQEVVYRSLMDGQLWTRAVEVFCQKVDAADGSAVLRFEPIAPYYAGARSGEFWPPDAQTVAGALAAGNYRYLQELIKLKKRKAVQRWKVAQTRAELEDLINHYMPVEIGCRLARDVTTGSYVSGAETTKPSQNQIMSLEDLIVTLLVKLRLDRRGLADIDYDESLAGVDPVGFVEWLDDTLEDMGYTDDWMRRNLLVSSGMARGKKLSKSYHIIQRGDPFESTTKPKDGGHTGEPG